MGPEAVTRVAKLPSVLLFVIITTTQSMTAEAGRSFKGGVAFFGTLILFL
jgi:hypothetical protein